MEHAIEKQEAISEYFMQTLFRSIIVALIVLASVPAFASPANPVEGIEYQTLALPQAVPAEGKVEVIAFSATLQSLSYWTAP